MGKPKLLEVSRLQELFVSNQDALVCLFDQGVVSVAGFATSVLIGRMAPEELGVYYIGLAMVLFARGFQQQLVSTPYTIYHHRQSQQDLAGYRGSCLVQQAGFLGVTLVYLLVQIIIAVAGIALLVAAGLWGLEFSGLAEWIPIDPNAYQVVPTLVVLLILIPAVLMRELVRHYCFTHSENISVLGLDTAVSVLQILALLALGYLGYLSGASAWIAIGLCCVVSIGAWYIFSGPTIEFPKEKLREDLKLNWSFGKWAVSGQFVGSLPTYLLPWLLLLAAGAQGVGFFAACMALVGIANIFNTGMWNFLTPKAAKVFVEEGRVGLKRVLLRMYGVFLVAVGSFALFLGIFGEWIAVVLFDPKYAGLQNVLTLLAVAKLFEGFSHTASGGLFAMEKIKANFWVDVVLMLVTITAALILIPKLGLVGAAWTSLIGSATSAILRTVLVGKFLGEKPLTGGADV